jgi:hypothetical protein
MSVGLIFENGGAPIEAKPTSGPRQLPTQTQTLASVALSVVVIRKRSFALVEAEGQQSAPISVIQVPAPID